MALLRINATAQGPEINAAPAACLTGALVSGLADKGPIIVMIHGFKYCPGQPAHCPHHSIFSTGRGDDAAWPRHLGFGAGFADEGLGIAFGWNARGRLQTAYRRAAKAGQQLAQLLSLLRHYAPERPMHILAHSLGAEVAFHALHHLPAGTVDRVVTLMGASFQSTAQAAMRCPTGNTAELINVTSRENDLFDFLFECLIRPPQPGDCSVGRGLEGRNIVTLQLDHQAHLAALARLGSPIAPSSRRVCHWSGYMRPGVLRLWARAMRHPERLPLALMAPAPPAPRWSRLVSLPAVPLPMFGIRKT